MKNTRHTNFIHFEKMVLSNFEELFSCFGEKHSVYRANKKENVLSKKLRIIQFPYMEIL